jgi:hypothetical protein
MATWFLADVCKFIEEDGIVVERHQDKKGQEYGCPLQASAVSSTRTLSV